MFESLEVMRMAEAMAVHASARQAVIARNVAHADTPGYRARDITPFSEAYAAASTEGIRTSIETFDRSSGGSPNGNSVSVETEIVKATETRHQHDMALSIYQSAMTILRASLGRAR